MVNYPFQASLAPRPTTVSGHNYPSVENKLKLRGLPLYTVLQKYAHIGLKQNLLRSTTLSIITRLRDNAAFVCVYVVRRFSKDFSEVRGLRSQGFQLQVEWMTTVLCVELRKEV